MNDNALFFFLCPERFMQADRSDTRFAVELFQKRAHPESRTRIPFFGGTGKRLLQGFDCFRNGTVVNL